MLNALIWRVVRTAASVGIASLVVLCKNDPRWIWLAPVISGIAKMLRDKFGFTNIPL